MGVFQVLKDVWCKESGRKVNVGVLLVNLSSMGSTCAYYWYTSEVLSKRIYVLQMVQRITKEQVDRY